MPKPIRSLLILTLVVSSLAALHAVPAHAASPGHATIPHVSCSYPGAPDCNMGPPSGGGSTGCGMTCGGGCAASCGGGSTSSSNCLVSVNGACLISGGSSPQPQTQSSSCPANYTPSLFGCQPPASNFGGLVTAGTPCTGGNVPANQIGIASSVCVNPNTSTGTNGPPTPQTKSCPGYAQQFPIAQSCPVPLPSSNACDIGIRTSLDAPDTTVSQACGTNQSSSSGTPCPGSPGITYTNDMTACPHDLCTGGLLAYPGPCASCNYGTAVGAANCAQCPGGTGTYGGPDPNAAGCPQGTYCPIDGGTAYAPTACQSCPGGTGFYLKDPSNCPKPPPSAAAGCGGSSLLLLPSMDLRVGDGPFVCVNCFLPGATTGTLMSSDECRAAGGSLSPASGTCRASALLLPSLDLRVGGAFPGCITCHLPDGTTKSESVGDCVLDGGSWNTPGDAAGSSGGTSSGSGGGSQGNPCPGGGVAPIGKSCITCKDGTMVGVVQLCRFDNLPDSEQTQFVAGSSENGFQGFKKCADGSIILLSDTRRECPQRCWDGTFETPSDPITGGGKPCAPPDPLDPNLSLLLAGSSSINNPSDPSVCLAYMQLHFPTMTPQNMFLACTSAGH